MNLRRRALRFFAVSVFLAAAVGLAYHYGQTVHYCADISAPLTPLTPEAALNELRRGNLRFVNSRRIYSADTCHDAERRREISKEQHPFAAILCCADSRICPEFIFDQRAGSIFEIRNAGNVVDEDVLASLEYAVEHLHVPLIVVLGHKGCGAIEAVCEAGEAPLPHHLRALQMHMSGIREQAVLCRHRVDRTTVDRLAEENARQQALALVQESPVLRAAIEHKAVRLAYGLYDLETGEATCWNAP